MLVVVGLVAMETGRIAGCSTACVLCTATEYGLDADDEVVDVEVGTVKDASNSTTFVGLLGI